MHAYKHAMRNYANFQGRASRSEYWLFILATVILGFLAAVLDSMLFGYGFDAAASPLNLIVNLVHLVPSLSVAVRRLHDTDRSGWFLLLSVLPLVAFLLPSGEEAAIFGVAALLLCWGALLVMMVLPGTDGPNRFGGEPLPLEGEPRLPSYSPSSQRAEPGFARASGGPGAPLGPSAIPAAVPAQASTTVDQIERLERLSRLKSDGTISDAEFARMKADIMQRGPVNV
jgi:uncharacterized membrane protein YhaH (DUF805 family)